MIQEFPAITFGPAAAVSCVLCLTELEIDGNGSPKETQRHDNGADQQHPARDVAVVFDKLEFVELEFSHPVHGADIDETISSLTSSIASARRSLTMLTSD